MFSAICECGWEKTVHNTRKTTGALHEQHQLDMLREAATVRTVEQLEALPAMSVVRDAFATVWEKDAKQWSRTGCEFDHPVSEVGLPALVLWQPEAVNR